MHHENQDQLSPGSSSAKKPYIEPELKAFDELEKQTQGFDFFGAPRAQLIGQFSP